MWKKTSFALLSLSLATVPLSVFAADNAPVKKPVDVEFMAINDFHGNIDTPGKWTMPDGKVVPVGGAQYLSAHFREHEADMKAKGGYSVRLASGDSIGASPAISSLLQDQPAMKVLDKLKIDLSCVGNHEFDKGIPHLNDLLSGAKDSSVTEYTKDYPDYEYKGMSKDFKYLAANVVDSTTNKPIFDPYAIKDLGGVKVGFIGVVTEDTPNIVMPTNVKDYKFLGIVDTVNKYAKELKDKGVNAITVVVHEGAQTTNGQTTGVMVDDAAKIDPDVKIIFAGHSHQFANGFASGKLIVQATSYLKAFSDVHAQLDPTTGKFVEGSLKADIVPNTQSDITPDPEVQKVIDEAKKITDKAASQPIGQAVSDQPIGKAKPEDAENPVGNLITDGQRTLTGSDFAITNSGGIRSALIPVKNDKGENILKWGAAYAVQPFGNVIEVLELTGQQIKDALNQQWNDPNHLMFLQISGFTYTYEKNPSTATGSPVYRVVDVKLANGSAMDMNAKYSVAMSEFIAAGGDKFSAFKNGKLLRAYKSDTDTFVEYIQKLASQGIKVDAKIEGRMKDVTGMATNPGTPSTTTPSTTPSTVTSTPTPVKGTLPNTSTDTYDWLLAGAGVMLVGGVMVMKRKKQA